MPEIRIEVSDQTAEQLEHIADHYRLPLGDIVSWWVWKEYRRLQRHRNDRYAEEGQFDSSLAEKLKNLELKTERNALEVSTPLTDALVGILSNDYDDKQIKDQPLLFEASLPAEEAPAYNKGEDNPEMRRNN